MTPRRIALVGPVGSGKSTLSACMAAHTGLPHLELDRLFWGPHWTPSDAPLFHRRVHQGLAADNWIADGNYGGAVADALVRRAQLLVWLDLPLRTCLPRLLRRSLLRAASGEELFGGNRETYRHLVARDSILWWGPAHHSRHRRRWQERLSEPDMKDTPLLRLCRPCAVAPALRSHGLLPTPPLPEEESCPEP